MTDRLDEIRARWPGETCPECCTETAGHCESHCAVYDAIAAAPEDIAFLLGEVERLRASFDCGDADYAGLIEENARLTADRERLVREAFMRGAVEAVRFKQHLPTTEAEFAALMEHARNAAVRRLLGDET